MSYRTYIEDMQIFGNNELYDEWIEFLQSQGVEINEEGIYNGEITDFMGALQVIEKITLRLTKERKRLIEKFNENNHKNKFRNLFDFTNIPDKLENQPKIEGYEYMSFSLFDELEEIVNNSYAFMPFTFYLACKDKLEPDKSFAIDNHFSCFKLKDGESIKVSAG